MGADRWEKCPKCYKEPEEPQPDWKSFTLREDWEIGVSGPDQEFFIVYSAGCKSCGFTFKYKHAENI